MQPARQSRRITASIILKYDTKYHWPPVTRTSCQRVTGFVFPLGRVGAICHVLLSDPPVVQSYFSKKSHLLFFVSRLLLPSSVRRYLCFFPSAFLIARRCVSLQDRLSSDDSARGILLPEGEIEFIWDTTCILRPIKLDYLIDSRPRLHRRHSQEDCILEFWQIVKILINVFLIVSLTGGEDCAGFFWLQPGEEQVKRVSRCNIWCLWRFLSRCSSHPKEMPPGLNDGERKSTLIWWQARHCVSFYL